MESDERGEGGWEWFLSPCGVREREEGQRNGLRAGVREGGSFFCKWVWTRVALEYREGLFAGECG